MVRLIAVCILLFCSLSFSDDFLVRLKHVGALNSFVSRISAEGLAVTRIYELVPGLMRVSGPKNALGYLNAQPEVAYAEVNHVRRLMILNKVTPDLTKPRPAIPGVVDRPTTWVKSRRDTSNFGLYQNQTKDIFEKRKFYGSEKTVIAVLDTGVDYTHRDLTANLWRNPGESGGGRETNGIDDDGNGYVDDVVGWDWVHQDGLPYDDYGHGTHVAGIAAAVGGDGWGMSGHCPRCSIMPLKFIGKDGGGTDADAIAGLEYAALMGATVINSSWGGEEYGQALFDAFEATSRLGIINAVAAGNNGVDLKFGIPNTYPAEFRIPGLYTIAALYEANITIPFWSNYGRPYVHFSMGGYEVYSTLPGGRHGSMSGTSMAAPGAAGILALMKSYRPGLTFDQITETLDKNVWADPRSMFETNFGGRPAMMKVFDYLDRNFPE